MVNAFNIGKEQRGRYFKTIDKRREGFHGFATRQFRIALQKQFNQFFDDDLDNKALFARNVDRITVDPIRTAMFRVHEVTGSAFALGVFNNFKSAGIQMRTKQEEEDDRMRDLFINAINGWVSLHLLEIMQSITQTTRSRITRIIDDLQKNPTISLSEFKERLAEGYVEVSLARSTFIGRTEIIRASNRGMLFAAAATGVPMNKTWVSTRDNRVRTTPPHDFDHLRPDGQTRALRQPFNISGQLLQFPADPSGAPGNTVNCRCTLSFQLI